MPEESKLAEKLNNEVKFTDDELTKVKTFQEGYFSIQNQLGQIEVAKLRIDSQVEDLGKTREKVISRFDEIQKSEKEFLEEITKKYGEGSLNPETGEFTPNKS